MIQKLIHRLLLRRHFWRHASFSEIAELYASRLIHTMAFYMAASFLSVYLYQLGYGVGFIALFWAGFYALKVVISLPMAAIVARIGAKHGVLVSNLLYIPVMVAFALLPVCGPWLLVVVAVFKAISASLYAISYAVDFSKVKSAEHAGKELAYMNIIQKVTSALSPLVGGLLAFWLGPQFVLVVAGVLYLFAAMPLMRTKEPVRPHQKLQLRGFPWHLIRGVTASQVAIGFDVFTSGTVWLLFTSITIIGINADNQVYATNGLLMSVIIVAAIAASYAFGRLIDKHRGSELLKIATLFNALTHLMRPFTASPIGIVGLNIANETATTGFSMAYTKGNFDNADLSGRRVTYLGILEVISSAGAGIAALTLAGVVALVGETSGMGYFFLVTAAIVLLAITARFPLYKK